METRHEIGDRRPAPKLPRRLTIILQAAFPESGYIARDGAAGSVGGVPLSESKQFCIKSGAVLAK
jgi:hypothetical protein